jgi:hypothetical protein
LSCQSVGSGDNFMNCYLPYFRQWFICCLLPAIYYCRLCLFKVRVESCLSPLLRWKGLPASYFFWLCSLNVHTESRSLLLSHSPVCSRNPTLFAVCPFQFLVYYSVVLVVFVCLFVCFGGVSLSSRLCWFITGVAVGVLCASYLLTCWSVSPKQVWNQCLAVQEPSWFLSVTWCGEALCRLGVRLSEFCFLFLVGFFLPVWLHRLSKIFDYGFTLSASSL